MWWKGGAEGDRGPRQMFWDCWGGLWLTAGSRPQAVPEAMQPGSGSVVSIGMGVWWEADPTLGLDAEPKPLESWPQSNFQFLDYQDPSDMLPGLGTVGVWSTS